MTHPADSPEPEQPVTPDQPDQPRRRRGPNASKYDKPSGPRPLTLKRMGLLNIEDYIPDENGNQRRYG